jgi:hypothetical protein
VKNSKWLLVAGLVIMMMAVGCKKMGETVDATNVAANPLVLPLVMGPNEVLVGHVYMWDDFTNVYVKYVLDVTPPTGKYVWLRVCQFDVELDSTQFPWNTAPMTINASLFGSQQGDVPYPFQEYMFTVPNVGAWTSGMTVAAVTHCVLFSNWDGADVPYSGWAQDPNHPFLYGAADCHGWWFPYTLGKPGTFHASTSWGGHAMPQWNMWQFPGNNWALYIRYNLSATQYVGDLYAGNPKNDPASKVVGRVTVSDDVVAGVGNIYVTYTITKAGYSIYSGHTIVRGALEDIPQVNGNPPPGQFDYIWGPFDPTVGTHTVTIPYDSDWGSDLYIGAHAIVGHY